ncbi:MULTISPECIES: preprotein translocase subunit SecE [Massilia]|jgi:preprotein translocase subunit SecE|uniref:Protein translocase subunit SecE n=3 Tax=Massilia TaxID=149698 RepID=A0A430HE96_9BURK|nr:MULTISPECIES: preprotein translocase subunit SecE [Massilia]NHZ36420.1 preprotein translocase subunit SecE [Massilia rubra]NHZ92059.1 preprotein translocase subunit SecE [Massilia mucilaginosa]NIA00715.1 preprotein translocase subunit SecE [Massilia sp. CCM 8734]RSZ55839.1 preprotein translocase subunit SecE [Massilia atriviolacea]
MSNQSVQTVSTSNDKFKVALAVVAAIAGVVGFFYLKGQSKPAWMCAVALAAGLVFAVLLLWTSSSGREFLSFAKESVRETKKVVWPAPKEAMQITGIVFAFVTVMALFLWGTDKTIEFLLYDVILGWK